MGLCTGSRGTSVPGERVTWRTLPACSLRMPTTAGRRTWGARGRTRGDPGFLGGRTRAGPSPLTAEPWRSAGAYDIQSLVITAAFGPAPRAVASPDGPPPRVAPAEPRRSGAADP